MNRFSALLVSGLLAFTQTVIAQDWPSRPIRVVSPYAAGGVGDTLFRVIAPALEAKLGQRFVIDNKTGAAGNIGTQDVIRAAPDGYSLLMAPTANYAVNQHLFKDLGFDVLTQLEPISMIAEAPLIAVVGGAVPAKSLKELADYVRSNPGKFNYGSPGSGSPTHLTGASFSQLTGNAMVYIPYKGTPPMVLALLSNDIQLAFPTLTPVVGHLKSGKLRALAVMARERLPELPDVATAVEAGFPQLVSGNWWVLSAPKGTESRIIERLAAEVRVALADPAVRKRVGELGHVAVAMMPAEAAAFIRAESARYKQILERSGIKPE